MIKYRVREQHGVFYIEKRHWLFGWDTLSRIVGNDEYPRTYETKEEAFATIALYQKVEAGPVYHYPEEKAPKSP